MVITIICVLVRAVVYKYRCIPFGSGWVLDGSGVGDDDVITAGDRTGEEFAVVWVLDGSGVDDDVIAAGDRRTGEEVAVVWVLNGSGIDDDDDDVIAAGDRRTGKEVAVVWLLDGSGFPVLSRAGNRTAHLRLVPGES